MIGQLVGAKEQAAVEALRRLDKHRRWQVVWTPDFCNYIGRHRVASIVLTGFDKRDEATASAASNHQFAVRENPDWCSVPVPS